MNRPVLSQLQRQWLLEIGLDTRMLAHFSSGPYAEDLPPEPGPSSQPGRARGPSVAVASGADAAEPGVRASTPVAGEAARHQPGVSPGAALVADLLKRAPVQRAPLPGHAAPPISAPRAVAELQGSSMPELRQQAEQCQACGLHQVRGRVVFGEGVETTPQWMFIGEAPGEYDDTLGLPFKGRAGDLLQEMLQSIGISGDAPAYFTNVLKCRPMSNRSPHADEIAACMPMLRQQIRQLRPASLVALGRVAAGALLGVEGDLDSLRGQVHQYVDDTGHSIPLVVTHHPASLLLHGQLKADAWRDLNLLRDLTT